MNKQTNETIEEIIILHKLLTMFLIEKDLTDEFHQYIDKTVICPGLNPIN